MAPDKENELKRLLESGSNARISMAICDLASGYQLLVHPDVPFHPASTFQLCVMLEVFHQVSRGEFSLDDLLLVKNSFISIADKSRFWLLPDNDSETDLYQHIGEQMPLRKLTRRMIVYSSNLATNLLIEKVGAERTTRFMQELGTNDLGIRRCLEDNQAYALGLNSATARSIVQVLVRLARREVVSSGASDEIIAILLQEHYSKSIPAKQPGGVSVAHKTGWNDKIYHDAAIVYPPEHTPYVVVTMTSGLSETSANPALVAALSAEIYSQLIGP